MNVYIDESLYIGGHMKKIWLFIADQIIGLKWLNAVVGTLLTNIGIDITSVFGSSLQFFIYDIIKIVILLLVLISFISYIQSFFPPERTKKILAKFSDIKGNIIGALIGTVTPFCSCSSIPIFIGLVSSGMPMGVTISFLISSPFVDLGSFLLLLSIFGLPIALTYMVVGVLLAVIGGVIFETLQMDRYIPDFVRSAMMQQTDDIELTQSERLKQSWREAKATLKSVIVYILIGVGIGSLIHNVIPQSIIEQIIGSQNPFAPILAALVGIPIYADIFGTIPIAEALLSKNVPIGTILTFMMGVTALSAPSIIMLSKVMKKKLLVSFVLYVCFGIILIGYFFNIFGYLFV